MRATKGLFQKAYRHKWLILLCLASLALRLYKLDVIPYGFNVDEAGTLYDAWCLATYGTERFGMSYPLFFLNYGGGGQSPLLTYLCMLLIKLFGLSAYAIRLPMVFSSMMTLIFGLKIIHRMSRDEKPMLIYAFFFFIMPYFNMAARFGLDCNLLLGFSTMFLFFFLKAVDSGRLRDFAICGVLGGLTLCTYTLSYIALPSFLLLMLATLLWMRKINVKQILCFCAGILPLALPLITMVIINQFQLNTLVIGPFTIPRLSYYRVSELSFPSLRLLLDTLSVAYGHDGLLGNSLPVYGTMFYLSPFLAALGFIITVIQVVKNFHNRTFSSEIVVMGWFLSMLLVGSMLNCGIECHRINGIYFVALYFVVIGAYQLVQWAMKFTVPTPQKWAARALCTACAGFYLFFGCHFFVNYFSQNKTDTILFSPVPKEAFDYIKAEESLNDRDIYFYDNGLRSYIYYMLAVLPNPIETPLTFVDGGVQQFGNVHFGLFDGVDENAVYVLRTNNGYWETMMEWGFSEIEFDDYILYYVE